MNDTATATDSDALPRSTPARPGLHQRLVMQVLQRMTAGHLTVEFPDGSSTGIGTPGSEHSATLTIRRDSFFTRVLLYGDIGFGEAYTDGDWDTDSIEHLIAWAILNIDNTPGMSGSRARSLGLNLLHAANRLTHLLRPNSRRTARRNIAEHYDLGNDFYQLWLDPGMTYSSGLYTHPDQTLEEAQEAKYDALCRKLQLRPSDHVLEIGTGWGGFASHAATRYGARITTVTISERQYVWARERMEREGLTGRVEVRLQDYRDVSGTYDKIASIEMMEALGDRYLIPWCRQVQRLLAPHGVLGVQYITVPDARHAALRRGVDWIQKHIFPGSLLLSIGRVSTAMARTGDLFLHHLEDFGPSYARTLREWRRRFCERSPEVEALGFDTRFLRKWNYYLDYCAAAFATRNISVVQAIYTRPNNRRLSS